jgi:HEAT repeat protein
MRESRVFAQASEDLIRTKFRQGVSAFEEERFADAVKLFEEVIALRPGHDLALELRDEAGYQLFVQMLAKGGDVGTVARKLLELTESARLKARADVEAIRKALRLLKDDDFTVRYRAMEEISAKYGQYVIPYLVEALGDRRDDEYRVTVITLLTKLGEDAVLPLVEICKSEDSFTRQNAAAILGHIRDIRAIPVLKKLADDPNESKHVRTEAAQALWRITGKESSTLESAKEYYYSLADRYYKEAPRVMINNYKEWVLWQWKEGKLVPRVLPRYSWNENVAEQLCYDGLETDSTYQPLWTLLLDVYFAELVEVESTLQLAKDKVDRGTISQEEVDQLQAARERLRKVSVLCSLRGKRALYRALKKALEDRNVLVAVAIIRALRDLKVDGSLLPAAGTSLAGYIKAGMRVFPKEVIRPTVPETPEVEPVAPPPEPTLEEPTLEEKPKEEPKPKPKPRPKRPRRISRVPRGRRIPLAINLLLPMPPAAVGNGDEGFPAGASLAAALTYFDKRVRYAAAEALARLNPKSAFADYERVVENLSDAVGETGTRVILVVERDDNIRNRIMGILRELNYMPFGVESGIEAEQRARSFPSEDLIIVSTELNVKGEAKDFTATQFIDRLREDYRTNEIPVLVLTPRTKEEHVRGLVETRAAGVITPDIDRTVLRDKLEEIFSSEKARRDSKARATAVAKSAAEALASLDPKRTIFNLGKAVPALTAALEKQPDEVRIPAMRALGNLQAKEALDKLAWVFTNKENRKPARVAAADAMGDIMKGGAGITPKIFVALKEALKEPDMDIFEACGRALGKARLTEDQYRKVFIEQRID